MRKDLGCFLLWRLLKASSVRSRERFARPFLITAGTSGCGWYKVGFPSSERDLQKRRYQRTTSGTVGRAMGEHQDKGSHLHECFALLRGPSGDTEP